MWHSFYRTQVNLGSDLWVRMSETNRRCADLTDVTLADEDTNSILTDNANRAIQGNVAMQWCNLVANFRTNASGATSCPNFEPMQVVPICNRMQVAKFAISANSSIWWPKCANIGWGIIWWQNFLLAYGRWRHLVAKFATNSSGPKFDWTFLEIIKCWFDRNTNLIFRNTANLKWRNIWTSQSRFNGQREQTLSTCVLILNSSSRGWTCSCTVCTPI